MLQISYELVWCLQKYCCLLLFYKLAADRAEQIKRKNFNLNESIWYMGIELKREREREREFQSLALWLSSYMKI